MTHAEFVAGYGAGRLQVVVDREAAARLVSGQLMLPFVLLPVLGAAVALALLGHLVAGILVFAAALAFRFAVRRTAHGFVLRRALEDERFYGDARAAGLLRVI